MDGFEEIGGVRIRVEEDERVLDVVRQGGHLGVLTVRGEKESPEANDK